jgi:hypothetical protein
MKLICNLTGHRRSAKLAKFDYALQGYRSACQHCGAPMVRSGPGDWSLSEQETGPGTDTGNALSP